MQTIEQSTAEQTASEKFGALWCDMMHDSPMWPIHGQYECRTCGRRYTVPWEDTRPTVARVTRQSRPAVVPTAMLPAILLLVLLSAITAKAADVPIVESTAGASMAFARYTASLEQSSPWRTETIEIEASLPKLAKAGRLRAIRRLLPFGKPEYQVLEIAGDATVKQQVIVRYLSAEVRAAGIPPATVAISPQNYNFRFKGVVNTGDSLAYIFLISPHKKREGLIKGELWLDADTGAVVRQSGYLVKRPSIFVKRVDLTRETVLRNGVADARVTHLSVDTRLVGRAELTIREHPFSASDEGAGSNIEDQ
jgi:hypothetical protein